MANPKLQMPLLTGANQHHLHQQQQQQQQLPPRQEPTVANGATGGDSLVLPSYRPRVRS